ncbi:DUF2207 domain-containing protein [bacterium]|nr:DUF2207 domain-containing protein [bacterium]
MKRIFVVLSCLFLLLGTSFAESFYIDRYDVDMDVKKDKSVFITENLDVVFTSPLHGIYRDIPFKNAAITDVRVSEEYTTTYTNSNMRLKIGNPNRYVSGLKHYTIRYKYSYFDNKNEFYHNIIGTDWKVPIYKVNFTITMPEPVPQDKVGLSIGRKGTRGFEGGAVYRVNGDTISGNTERALSPGEGITVRAEVPEGYFVFTPSPYAIFVIILMIILTALSFFIWYSYGKDEPVIPVVNFYPPKNMNALETELAYKGKASTKGLTALLIELAQKGYIKIINDKEKWSLQLLHVYDGNNKSEKKFIKALFNGDNEVSQSDLMSSKSFYKDCEEIVEEVNQKKDTIFTSDSISFPLKAIMVGCVIGILLLTMFAVSYFSFSSISGNGFLLVFPLIAIIMLIATLKGNNSIYANTFIIIWALFFGGGPLIMLFEINPMNNHNIPAICVGMAGLVISVICTYQLPKRNPSGQKKLNHLMGLKHFIEVAEKHRLSQLVEENPEYFYNVLPSAYILGVSDKWIEQFKGVMEIEPDWYSGKSFSVHSFNTFMGALNSASVPTTANGGISSSSGGGGFSGGGGGGGGGGGW